jgi:predicted nuclease of predicted toxin-antitoxin system
MGTRLKGKIKKGSHRELKEQQRRLVWRFYLDVGKPVVADFLRWIGCDVLVAEEAAGAAASDESHLNSARHESRIFVTTDLKCGKRHRKRLQGSPGIIVVKALNVTQEDLMHAMRAFFIVFKSPEQLYERGLLVSTDQMKLFEADGTSTILWSRP